MLEKFAVQLSIFVQNDRMDFLTFSLTKYCVYGLMNAISKKTLTENVSGQKLFQRAGGWCEPVRFVRML